MFLKRKWSDKRNSCSAQSLLAYVKTNLDYAHNMLLKVLQIVETLKKAA